MKKFFSILIVVLSLVLLSACSGSVKDKVAENIIQEQKIDKLKEEIPVVTIKVKDFGEMKLELYPQYAPITVENFLSLAESGFYEGLTFHRIYKGFMIQGGSLDGIGIKGSDKKIKGEFAKNGVNNPISHERGVISMARTNDPNSASSQFFICDADSTFLDGSYAAFGKVIEGYDVLDAIASTEVTYGMSGEKSTPLVAPVIENITVNK